jgi:RNA-directed DNA polymerase
MNLSRGDGVWRDDRKPALDNLIERIFTHENVTRAWARVKSNRGVAGVDGMTIEDYPAYAAAHWDEIRQTLKDGTYQPQPVRRVTIPHTQAERRRTMVRDSLCPRPGNPTSHPASVKPHL